MAGLSILLGFVLSLCPGTSTGQPTNPPLQATDLLEVEDIRDLTLSSSGRTVAYTVRRSTDDSPPENQTHLYAGPSNGRGSFRMLTRTGPDATQPAWHPNESRLAFVRPVEGTPQIFVLSLRGGEPYQLTDLPTGATDPQWSPNGNRLLFSSRLPERLLQRRSGHVPPSDRPGRTPGDLTRFVPPDTLLVLRHAQTLDPVDTLALGPDGRPRLRNDTARALRTPTEPSVPADTLSTLPPDSVYALFEQLRVRPDTTTVPVSPDTTATPDGDLLQLRRWLEQSSGRQAQTVTRPAPQPSDGLSTQPSYRHYFVVDVPEQIATGHPPRPSATPVTEGYRSFGKGAWLPGGSQIVVSAAPPDSTHPDRVQKRNLYVVDLTPYRIQRLLQIDGYALSTPRVTSDGTTLAFRAQSLSSPTYDHAEIGLFELDGRSAPRIITDDFDRDVHTYRWSPDGWYLYVTAPSQGGRPLYRFAPFARNDTTADRGRTSLRENFSTSRDTFALDSTMVRTAQHERVVSPTRVVQAFDVTDSKAVYASLGPETPSELYTNTVSFTNEQRLSSHNTSWVSQRRLASFERIDVWSENLRIRGRVTRPLSSSNASEAPLVVLPRGGPPALGSVNPLSSWAERQYLAGRGYGVLEVWPRGSVGYGDNFRRRSFQNWGPGPARDVLTLADTIASRSWADSTQQLAAGRGYGGYLAAWLVGHTHRFQAAVAQNGLYDLTAAFGTGTIDSLLHEQFGGPPWDATSPSTTPQARPTPLLSAGLLPSDTTLVPRTAFRRNSPITNVSHIETPLLLLHGTDDQTTGPAQAEMLYRRLKHLERPVEYVRYPNVGHNFATASPLQRVDRLTRLHEFFSRYVDPVPAN